MELSDILESLHGSEWSFCIFLELLKVSAISIHFTVPLEVAAAEVDIFNVEKKRPYDFAIEEIFESFGSTIMK